MGRPEIVHPCPRTRPPAKKNLTIVCMKALKKRGQKESHKARGLPIQASRGKSPEGQEKTEVGSLHGKKLQKKKRASL